MKKVSKSNSLPLISVIVPVYKVEQYLDKCIDSIVNQTYKNLEIILVDDGSPDNCPKMCDDWAKKDKRIKVIHKGNGGVSLARNIGIDESTGEYISFVDSDDWIENTFFEELLNISLKYNSKYITCGYKRVYDTHVEYINNSNRINEINSSDYLIKLLNVQNGYGFVHMKLINRDVIDNLRFDEELKVGEDALFNVKLCNNTDSVVIYNKALYNYYFNNNSVVRKYDDNYVNKYLKSMYVMYNFLNDKKNIDKVYIYNYIAYHVLLIAVNYCYHPLNSLNKMKSLKKVCNIPLFKDSITNSNYKNLSLTRKITLFTIKHKLYLLTSLICKYRQRQFKK